MVIFLTIIHVVVCLFLIVVVLLQSGKAADLAGAFGGMGSQTAFGPRGAATVLSKATTIAAALFMVTSLSLSIFATRNAGVSTTVLEKHKAPATKAGETTKGAPANPSTGPSVTLFPEGNEAQGVTVPLEMPPPGQTGGPPPLDPAPAQSKQPAAPASAPAKK